MEHIWKKPRENYPILKQKENKATNKLVSNIGTALLKYQPPHITIDRHDLITEVSHLFHVVKDTLVCMLALLTSPFTLNHYQCLKVKQ